MDELKFIALSGTISVTENLYVYETAKDMVVLDCGVGFPDMEMRGVDLVVPDFSYILKNKAKLRGIVVSQGHEDHIGAIPFLLREVDTEIWSTIFVKMLLEDKLDEYDVRGGKLNVFDPSGESFNVGSFSFHPFRVTHSIPDTVGFAIDTPQGRIFHVPEHKMDQEPVDGMATDIQRIQNLAANKKILFLASDCLGSNKPGYTEDEKKIEENIQKIVNESRESVYFTAISSNISRFQQAINTAVKTGRKAVYVGRSVEKKCEIAHELGYLKYREGTVIPLKSARKYERRKLMYLVSGCYGQEGSSLYKLSLGEHKKLAIRQDDTLIFSADPAPPYSKESEDFVIDNFIDMGVDVHYYDLKEGIYVSGHGGQKDIMELFNLVKPRYYIPIGGAIRYMHSYKKLALSSGAKPGEVFELKPGDNISFKNGKAERRKRISVRQVLVEGSDTGGVGNIILGDRRILSQNGIVVVILPVNNKSGFLVRRPKISSRGFIFGNNKVKILSLAENTLEEHLKGSRTKDLKEKTTVFLENFFFQKTGRRPMILPIPIEA